MPISRHTHSSGSSFIGKMSAAMAIMALLGTATAAQAGAQEEPALCNGLVPTIILSELNEPGAATEGDDVVVFDFAVANEIEFNELPLFLTLGGNDTVCLRSQSFIYLFTGSGQDTVIVEEGSSLSNIWAGPGDDTIIALGSARLNALGEGGNDTMTGGTNNDDLDGGEGDDIIRGGAGDDRLHGGDGNDELYGEAGSDRMDGDEGNDELYGGYGNDRIDGGDGDDMLFGSRGDDQLAGSMGADTIYGGAGNDTLNANWMTTMNPHAASQADDVAGSRMFGGEGDDMLWGSNRWDRMQGGPGDDMLAGFEGRDYMRGGPGNDNIIGGANIDDVNGNTGRDRVFIQGGDIASGGFGIDECGGFAFENIVIPASCENTFSTTMAEINANMMMTGGGD